MDNIITITLKDKRLDNTDIHRIEFQHNPTVSELCACKLIIEEVLEHNFKKEEILRFMDIIYPRLENLEEVRRNDYE